MLNRIKSPAVIISTLAFAAMVVIFIAHFQLVEEDAALVAPQPVVEPAIDVAAAALDPVVETTGSSDTIDPAETVAAVQSVSYEEAETAYLDGRYAGAVELFAAYTERRAENPWGFYMLGLSAWKADDIDTAERAFEQAIALDPTHVKSYINLSRALLDAGRPTVALVQIHEAIALDPRSGVARRLEGVALHAIGKRGEAIDAYRRAIEAENEDAWAMNNLALVYIEEGRHEEALRVLARATELRDDVPVFYNNLGMALEHSGRFVQATEAYDRAATLDGGYTRAIDNYNRVATVLEDPTLAPVDLAALAADFAVEVDGWSETVVATGEADGDESLEAAVETTVLPVDSTATGER